MISSYASDPEVVFLARFSLFVCFCSTAQLPYTVESEEDNSELSIFTNNEDVQDLRDRYLADLVVLVGVFPAVCGRA